MKTSVQARLDEETRAALDLLKKRHGWSTSQVVREGLQLLARQAAKPVKIIGLGKYDSGLTDLGSNKKHLEGFGLNSGIGRKPKRERKAS